LILDEPTNGLDPRASRDVQQRLRKNVDEGMTIFLSTHILDMAERLCSRIGIIHQGQLVATGSPQELKEKVTAGGTLEQVFLAVTEESASA
jgi:ABC-2 type transport system ATP-binding protein